MVMGLAEVLNLTLIRRTSPHQSNNTKHSCQLPAAPADGYHVNPNTERKIHVQLTTFTVCVKQFVFSVHYYRYIYYV